MIMSKKWIAFYISSHGFGHMTRCLAQIEDMLEKTDYNIYIATGKFQNEFARTYLASHADRLLFRDVCTDIGLINMPNSLAVDTAKLEKELYAFIASWDETVEEECRNLHGLAIERVICDISPIGVLVGKKLGVETIGISNFTWVEQYEKLDIDQQITEKFREVYAKLDRFIEYELALPMETLKVPRSRIGFISRKINLERVAEIKREYGNNCIFITCGKSADLEDIHIRNFDGCIITTSGINVVGGGRVVLLPVNTLDTHNYIAASRLVIAKAGWGTISEAVAAGTKLVLIERDGGV